MLFNFYKLQSNNQLVNSLEQTFSDANYHHMLFLQYISFTFFQNLLKSTYCIHSKTSGFS